MKTDKPAKLDYTKQYKDLYLPGKAPVFIDVPEMPFFMIDGDGAPESPCYQNAVGVLYALSFTIKMSKMSGSAPDGYFEYVVPPLEGLWELGEHFDLNDRDAWRWTSMIRQPEFVTPAVFEWALATAAKKKPELDFSGVRFAPWREGLCVQAMHIGPFSEETVTVAGMNAFIKANGASNDYTAERRHHEIYLGDPRRTAPEKRRTVLRLPVRMLENA